MKLEECDMKDSKSCGLHQAIMLQINEKLFRNGIISQSIYEQMKVAIVDKAN